MHQIQKIALATLALLLLTLPSLARETINAFTQNVILMKDGSIDVTETIEVNVERDEINHGIYRDIFTVLVNDDKSRLRSSLKVISVLRDGVPEPHSVEGLGNTAKRIRIGDADVWLDRRTYTYTIRYTMSRMGRSIPDRDGVPAHDELYWNVTGNYWIFPILKVVATVQLPPGVAVEDAIGYTGVLGSRDTENVAITRGQTGNSVTFRTQRPLNAFSSGSEGLTIAVSFPKGTIAEATGLTAVGYWLSDHRDVIFPTIAVLLVLAYNLLAWGAVGRDPERGTIIPRFHAPKNFSPALSHYISNMGFKQSGWQAFTASIFDLGVKGLVEISKPGKNLEIKVVNPGPVSLPSGEAGLFSYLNTEGRLTIDKTTGAEINKKRGEFVETIERENRETYFKNNIAYVLGGVALGALLLGALVWLEVLQPIFIIVAIVAAIGIGIVASIFSGSASGNWVGRIITVVWIAAFGINAFGSSISWLQGLTIDTGLIAAITIVAVSLVFAVLMRAPTVQGRKIMDELDGFKMYMDTAEKNRLNMVGEPPMTITRFEAILPFAIALGVEKPWSQHFEAELSRNAVADAAIGTAYSPAWYSGNDWSSSSSGFSNTVSSLSSGMSAAMIAAQPVQSSNSGFSGGGGGGGSGGGGGGGGGGGW